MRIERAHQSQHPRDMPLKGVIANWWERVQVVLNQISTHGRRGNGAAQLRELVPAVSRLGCLVPHGAQKCIGAGPHHGRFGSSCYRILLGYLGSTLRRYVSRLLSLRAGHEIE
eukprot:6943221-Pyramimonas_sp.AAC.1